MPGWPHPVTRRGNHRQIVFYHDKDHRVYLEILAKYKTLYHFSLSGYSLMTNHNVLIPEFDDSMAKGIGRTNNDFSRRQNVRCSRTGHLRQARFYSCPFEFASLAEVLAYIELNPVRAGIVKRPEDWKRSSARAHLMGIDKTGLLDMTWCPLKAISIYLWSLTADRLAYFTSPERSITWRPFSVRLKSTSFCATASNPP
jgi:putative transposase